MESGTQRTLGAWSWWAAVAFGLLAGSALGVQPKIGRTADEPVWTDVLRQPWGLHADRDLRNPLLQGAAPAATFRRADRAKPVAFKPIIALGMETTTRGGWYAVTGGAANLPADVGKAKRELWTYAYKPPADQRARGGPPPPLASGTTTFDPGDAPFGLWVSNDNFNDAGVYTQPGLVAKVNPRLAKQPYKVMIYPHRDLDSGKLTPHRYLIGWEYSTNDDFQDVVTQIDNVTLLAGGFKFVEGPTWDAGRKALYSSDIPAAAIVRYGDGKARVANDRSGQSNGLMMDKDGMLVACEHEGRRLSRAVPGQPGRDVITHYQGKRLNSPNDLWLDQAGGIYFTDPRYGPRDDLELDTEAVYYVSGEGKLTRIIDDLVRPNGIALSPDGKTLYVADNGGHSLHRYPVPGPGKIGRGERIANVSGPDGMTVDARGRLYVTCAGGVWVLGADGKWLGMIATPERPANCTFGGPGQRTLFITARTGLYGIETLTRGWHVHLDGRPTGK